jgi:hypothetical protein
MLSVVTWHSLSSTRPLRPLPRTPTHSPQGFVTLVQLEAHFARRLQEDRRAQDSGGMTADELDYYLTQQKHMCVHPIFSISRAMHLAKLLTVLTSISMVSSCSV